MIIGQTAGTIALEAVAIDKRYGGTHALKSVNVTARAGEIHALIGQNGAGKSTFLGVAAGRVKPSSGEMTIFGQPYVFGSPRSAKAHGISAIYQELTVVPAMSAVANVFLGQSVSRFGMTADRRMIAEFRELCRLFDVRIEPTIPAGRLSVADQQMLEIMRGVQSKSRILLFDEPTAALAPPERQALFRIMRQLRGQGVAMMLVSHNLEEVLDISDRITVFRDGQVVASEPTDHWSKASLVRAMIGHDIKEPAPRNPRKLRAGATSLISARGVTLPGAIEAVDIDVNPGEIVGIGGLVGSGRTSLLRCLAGLEPQSTGELIVNGEAVAWPVTPRMSLKYGIALVPEDRKTQGLVLGRTSVDNICMTEYGQVSRLGVLQRGAMETRTREVAREFGFAEKRIRETMRNLSGGNQQKMLLGKWAFRTPRVLLVDEPTRGIDIGAKEEIVVTLRKMADRGLGIVVVSSELEEVVALGDRVIVLSHGHSVATLSAAAGAVSVPAILNAAFKLNGEDHVQHLHSHA